MVDCTPLLPGLSPVQGKAIIARFDGGRLSSEGGLLALHEIVQHLNLTPNQRLALHPPANVHNPGSYVRDVKTKTSCLFCFGR
jgi:hypothetical protein